MSSGRENVRLWSLHPKYLDQKGLLAAWREGLLALAVLQGKTTGYRHHPQLLRFQRSTAPVHLVKRYLWHLYQESLMRGYHFNPRKLTAAMPGGVIEVTAGQMAYEKGHLLAKLKARDPARFRTLRTTSVPEPNMVFTVVPGGIEDWERI